MTDHERAFLTAIADEPDADVHRLIYADWLDEQAGEATPRGEFIRVQVELSRPSRCENPRCKNGICFAHDGGDSWDEWDCSCGRAELRRREQQLFSADDAQTLRWFGLPQPWARIVRLEPFAESAADYPYAVARRGFISRIALPTAAFLQHAAGIIEAVPMLEEVRLTDKEPELVRDGSEAVVWRRFSSYRGHTPAHLPDQLFRRLHSSIHAGVVSRMYGSTFSRSYAQEELSQACLAFARDQLARRRDPKKYARPRSVTYP